MNGDPPTSAKPEGRRRFSHIAIAGITFQAGSAAVDSGTVMSALVHQLTGSPLAVGAATAILRFGWQFPQFIVGYLAERRASSMRYYVIGGFGRAFCLALLAVALAVAGSSRMLPAVVLLLWTAYAFVSGIVAVPYNDIVARSVLSEQRSRLLATRFFGGGILALAVAAVADFFVGRMQFPMSYAAIIAMASALMFVSSFVFVMMGEPPAPPREKNSNGFLDYLTEGVRVFHTDTKFRQFLFSQWCGGAALIAMPFYVVQAADMGFELQFVALLLGAQTAGSLSSNLLWGWWGDRLGKRSLLEAVSLGRIIPPILVLLTSHITVMGDAGLFINFLFIFFVLGALANGLTIAVIGYLMEISPEDKRPSYSGYFNALTAPAFLFPLLGGAIATVTGLTPVFITSLIGAVLQFYFLRALKDDADVNSGERD